MFSSPSLAFKPTFPLNFVVLFVAFVVPFLVAPFDLPSNATPLFPTYAQTSLNGSSLNVHLPTSSKKVINLNDLTNKNSDPNFVPYLPAKRLKRSYDHTRKFQLEWVVKLSWGEGVLIDDGKFNMVNCKVCTTINRKPCLLAPKWDTLMKHEGRRKAKKDFPKLKIMKGD